MNNSIKLFSGGLAETVPQPTLLTFSFLQYYFTTSRSIGKALDFLTVPHIKSDTPLLVLHNKYCYLNLAAEEQTIYGNTVFRYKPLSAPNDTPQLYLDYPKLFSLSNLKHTAKLTFIQSDWIGRPNRAIEKINSILGTIPDKPQTDKIDKIDEILVDNLWPTIIALGILAEFYAHLLKSYKFKPDQEQQITQFISHEVSQNDWILQSIKDLYKVKTLEMTYADYINEYGFRADQDYEFSSPRWHETPELMKEHVEKSIEFISKEKPTIIVAQSIQKIVDANIKVQIMRSLARKKILPYINIIRQFIIRKYGDKWNWDMLTRDIVLFGQNSQSHEPFLPYPVSSQTKQESGKGIPVSAGEATGTALHIENSLQKIPPNTIAIFPNASPEFTMQFPACKGIIFKVGGSTSHGAIVSREYTIPALVDSQAQSIPTNAKLWINGATGEWRVESTANQ